MSNSNPTIDYHAARAMEELERAEAAASDISRRSHMELSGLHLRRAAQLRAARGRAPKLTVVRSAPPHSEAAGEGSWSDRRSAVSA